MQHLLRGLVSILAAWSIMFAVMLVAYHGYLPKIATTTVFLFCSSCVFPYTGFNFSDSAEETLTVGHWVFSVLGFTLLGGRPPFRWAIVAALIVILLLALIARIALYVIGFQ
jgi:hypothetical protein